MAARNFGKAPRQSSSARANGYFRRKCFWCPGYSDGVDTLTKVELSFVGEKPFKVLVCEDCLKAGDIDKRLKDCIEHLEDHAEILRAMIGKLKVPSYQRLLAYRKLRDLGLSCD